MGLCWNHDIGSYFLIQKPLQFTAAELLQEKGDTAHTDRDYNLLSPLIQHTNPIFLHAKFNRSEKFFLHIRC